MATATKRRSAAKRGTARDSQSRINGDIEQERRRDDALRRAVMWSETGNEDALIELMQTGGSDIDIRACITAALGDDGCSPAEGESIGADRLAVCWRGGKDPAIWFDSLEIPARRKPDLTGKKLIAAVRKLLSIPPAGKGETIKPSPQMAVKDLATSGELDASVRSAAQPMANDGEREIPIDEIEPSPLNPRKRFDETKLAELAESIKKHGLLQALVVWTAPAGRLELIAGERRYRACKLAKLQTVRCRVLHVTPSQAIELRGIENEQRENFDPIERAIWYQQMIDQAGYTQAKLAKRLNCSQASIAQQLGLLKLPAEWADRIITQVITPTHARHLLPWLDRPKVLEAVEKAIAHRTEISVNEFRDQVNAAVNRVTKPMNKADWRGPKFSVTKKRREELDVVKVPNTWGGGHEPRAFNVALWNKLQREATAKEQEQQAAETPSTPTKQTAKDGLNEYQLQRMWSSWLCYTIAEKLGKRDKGLVGKLLLLMLGKCDAYDSLDVWLQPDGKGVSRWLSVAEVWSRISERSDKDFADDQLTLLRQMLTSAAGEDLDLETLQDVAAACSVGCDPLAEWEPTYEWLELFSVDDLRRMPATKLIQSEILPDLDKPDLIERLLENWQPGYVPKPIADALPERKAVEP